MDKRKWNEEASASGILTLVFVFMLCGILFVMIGFAIDRVVTTAIQGFSMFPVSQMRVDILKIMIMIFRFEPFIIVISLGINHLINANRSTSGFSDLSTLAISAGEMIILTVVIIALTFFGGMGVEMVINIINTTPIGSPDLGLFSAIQYTLPVFYGMCVIGLMGSVIQFVVQCVSTVDYTQQY